MPSNIRLEDVLQASVQANRAGLHTCLPGVVKFFDPLTTTVTVQPTVKNPIFDVDTGERGDPEDPPVIPNVPVIYPRGGGFHVSFPLKAGDHVVLVFSELSTAQWRTTGEVAEPGDVRRHSLGYPFAIPGAFPLPGILLDQNPVSVLTAGKLCMGVEKNPAMTIRVSEAGIEVGGLVPLPLAMGPAVAAAFSAIQTWAAALQAALLGSATPAIAGGTMAAPAVVLNTALTTAATAVPATISKGQ